MNHHTNFLDADTLALWTQDTPSATDSYSVTTDCGGLRCFSITCISCANLIDPSAARSVSPIPRSNNNITNNQSGGGGFPFHHHHQMHQDMNSSFGGSSPQLHGLSGVGGGFHLHSSQSHFDLSSPMRTSTAAPAPVPPLPSPAAAAGAPSASTFNLLHHALSSSSGQLSSSATSHQHQLSGIRRVASTGSLLNNLNTNVSVPPLSFQTHHHRPAPAHHPMQSLGSEGNLSQLSASPVSTSNNSTGMKKSGSSRDVTDGRIQKRLARKAELARESRKRKKAHLTELEEKIDKLQYRIAEMEEQVAMKALKNEESSEMGFVPQSEPFYCGITDVDALSDMEIQNVISNFEKVTLGRKLELDECLTKVRNAITPSKQVKFLLWAFDQKDSFYEGPGLWNSLLGRELECSEEAVSHLKSMRDAIRKDRRGLQDLDQELGRLSTEVNQYFHQLGMLIVELGKIMTGRQLAKFIAWIENSEWCMQMLDSLWCSVFEQEL
eukprot:TRINITY_DN9073_c0_g1_i2.p1 TRINITY_DN9073_c0_g1~~TRINITY_DN9073_c0_g1_i2.p1  ORF type:complete len:494 (+),score=116.19 TRINITY_DN9073_c0_g1_i2:169-1650(+)